MIELGELEIQVFHPGELTGDRNVDSIVLLVTCGQVGVLLTGDAEISSEASMIAAGVPAQVIDSHGEVSQERRPWPWHKR